MPALSRRSLLTGAALLPGALQVRGAPANSALHLGIIGTGGRGQLVGGFFATDERVRIAALCDLYDDRIEQARAAIRGARTALYIRITASCWRRPGSTRS